MEEESKEEANKGVGVNGNLIPFKKGDENINRTGLNKGSNWSKTIIRKYLDQKIKRKDLDDNEIELPAGELAIIAVLKQALDGNFKALKELLDRLEGTPTQTINQNIVGEKNKPINEWVDEVKPTDETQS